MNWYFTYLNNFALAAELVYQQLVAALVAEYPNGPYPGM